MLFRTESKKVELLSKRQCTKDSREAHNVPTTLQMEEKMELTLAIIGGAAVVGTVASVARRVYVAARTAYQQGESQATKTSQPRL